MAMREIESEIAVTDGDRIVAVDLAPSGEGADCVVTARYFLDATETGELLRLASAEYVTGAESRSDTGEPHAPDRADPMNMQAITFCFAVEHLDGNHTIDRPELYDYWRSYQPTFWGSPLLSWTAPDPKTLEAVTRTTLVNWPQVDYFDAPVIDVPDAGRRLWEAEQLSLSLLYWMQTEAPRADGGTGLPGLRLRADVVGTTDGLAQAPYVRESRRIVSECRIVEQDLALDVRGARGAVRYPDSVGIGMYRIDLHPSTGGDNYIDVASSPFQIPPGALIPVRIENLLPAAKNIGTTHITNGCYRLHPVEWNVGEVAGELAAHCLGLGEQPRAVRGNPSRLADFQRRLDARGVERDWPQVAGY
jgi:hypothetical protein